MLFAMKAMSFAQPVTAWHPPVGPALWGACLGVFMLALNLTGFLLPLRDPAIYRDPANGFPNDIVLTYDQVHRDAPRRPGETNADYVARVTTLVNRGMAHRWLDDKIDAYGMHVPARENPVLYAAGYLWPQVYGRYEFIDPDRAMARGIGLCSQHALAVAGYLRRAGIEANIFGLNGHVVALVRTSGGEEFVADADFGVVLPYSRAALEANPELARPYYTAALTALPPADAARLVGTVVPFYGPEGNYVEPPGDYVYVGVGEVEDWAYRLKWLLPLALLAPVPLTRVRRGWGKRTTAPHPVRLGRLHPRLH